MSIGRGTYGVTDTTVFNALEHCQVTIGSFCSIAAGVQIHAASHHRTDLASTFPFAGLKDFGKGPVVIGDDVWIGARALILSNLTIGTGAVVGAGAVVTRSVEPYAIVAGNPARLIRYRFDEDVRRALLDIAWWTWSDEKIAAEQASFSLPIEDFLRRHMHGKG